MLKRSLIVGAAALSLATSALAEIKIHDAYARAATPSSKTGAAFMMIRNEGGEADRLLGVASGAAQRVELHTHIENDGVMRMVHVEEGFDLPKDGEIAMKRGGNHVMLMGLNQPLLQGDKISVTLSFEKAGNIVIEVPVDLKRQDHANMTSGSDG